MKRLCLILALLFAAFLALPQTGPAMAAPAGARPEPTVRPDIRNPGQGRANPGKRIQSRISWDVARIDQTIAPGESAIVTVTVSSTVDLDLVTFSIPGNLGRITTIEAAPASLKANQPATVTLRFAMPAEKARNMSGVLTVRAAQRQLPASLPLHIMLPST